MASYRKLFFQMFQSRFSMTSVIKMIKKMTDHKFFRGGGRGKNSLFIESHVFESTHMIIRFDNIIYFALYFWFVSGFFVASSAGALSVFTISPALHLSPIQILTSILIVMGGNPRFKILKIDLILSQTPLLCLCNGSVEKKKCYWLFLRRLSVYANGSSLTS